MLSQKLFKAYVHILRYAEVYHCVPYVFNKNLRILEMRQGFHLYIVYFNNLLGFLFTVFLLSQYFMATAVIAINKLLMTNALALGMAISVMNNILMFQNIFMGHGTMEFFNMSCIYFRGFRGNNIFVNCNNLSSLLYTQCKL